MHFIQSAVTSLAATGLLWNHDKLGWNASANASFLQPTMLPNSTQESQQIVEILVGAAGKLAFNPDFVSVTPGTILRFNFLAKNHTLTQSSFHHPCSNSSQFDTGFNQFNPYNVSGKFLVDYEVVSEQPKWFYCAQNLPISHCEAGMVFSLNSVTENTKEPEVYNITTSSVAHNFCHNTMRPFSTNRPNQGSSSRTFLGPNTTSISPTIANGGRRLGYQCLEILGSIFFTMISTSRR